MWFLLRLFSIVLCFEYSIVRNVVGEDCRFWWPNGTELEVNQHGVVQLQQIRDDTEPGTKLMHFNTKYVEKITKVEPHGASDLSYILPLLEENNLTLSVSDDFTYYEETELTPSFTSTVTFQCLGSGTKQLDFVLPVKDINNHKPEFQKTPYVYQLPMPYPKGLILGDVYARDVDMSNTNVTFYLDSTDPNVAGLMLSWSIRDIDDQKLYKASISTNSTINFLDDVTFFLHAIDSPSTGSALQSSTNVTIRVDRKNSILRFAKPFYKANLTNLTFDDANEKLLAFSEGDIVLNGEIDNVVNFDIQDELAGYREYFEPFRLTDSSTVKIRLKNPPEKLLQESAVLLKLTAEKLAASESTIISISLPGSVSCPSIPCSSTTVGPTEHEETSGGVLAVVFGVLFAIATISLVVIVVRKQNLCLPSKKVIASKTDFVTKL